ncbi:unnamed protein product [Ectocarpus sp. CCAP 1310/34]|nr:unnamed protein product [Ectocarpus sp. CCAP 1310/34]
MFATMFTTREDVDAALRAEARPTRCRTFLTASPATSECRKRSRGPCGLNIQSCGMMQSVESFSVCWVQELLVRCSNQ